MAGASAAGTSPALLVVGVNHRSSPLELRDRFALVEAGLMEAIATLSAAGLDEAALIATCDRVELVTMAAGSDHAAALLAELLAERTGVAIERIEAAFYRHEGSAALRHLFAVTSGLDSLVIGDPQVLGQVKAAHRLAAELGLARGQLEVAFSAAYQAARRVRRETRIAERPVSIAAAALELARDIHGDLDACTALLLGPGEMGELIVEQFRRAGVGRVVVCGPAAWVERASQRFSCNLAALEELDGALAAADIVVAALGSGRAVLTAPRVAAALGRRPHRPIFVVDAALPADAEPAVNDLEGAFLYNLGDLEGVALAGRVIRKEALAEAWRIVEMELAAFAEHRAARRAVPAVLALRRHVEALRREALAEAKGDAETATRLLMGRLLHAPSEVLRDMAGAASAEEVAGAEDMLRRLFRLGGAEESDK